MSLTRFSKSQKKYKQIGIVVLMLMTTSVAVWGLQRNFYQRSRAAAPTAVLRIEPSSISQTKDATGMFNVYVVPNGGNVGAVELVLSYDPSVIQILGVAPGNFFTDPAGQIGSPNEIIKTISTPGRIHYAIGFPFPPVTNPPTPPYTSTATGSVVTVSYKALAVTTNSPISFITTGQPQTMVAASDATNILSSVQNAVIMVTSGSNTTITPSTTPPTVTFTPTPTPASLTGTPTPTRTPTPSGGLTPTTTLTPTGTPVVTGGATTTPQASPTTGGNPQQVTLKYRLQGKTRPGISNASPVVLKYRPVGSTTATTLTLQGNSSGEMVITIAPGSYVFLLDVPGYLARRIGTNSQPVVISPNNQLLDLSTTLLLGGDFNDDGVVNEVDFTLLFLANYAKTHATVDLDASGQVNNLDFGIMRNNWNKQSDTISS